MAFSIPTYIIGHYNPSVRIIDLVSYTTYVGCVNFIHKWRDLQFKVNSERQIFSETFHGNSIFTLRVFARNLLRGKRWRNTFRISFWCLARDSNPGFLSNKPTHFLLDHGNFYYIEYFKICFSGKVQDVIQCVQGWLFAWYLPLHRFLNTSFDNWLFFFSSQNLRKILQCLVRRLVIILRLLL